MGKVNRLFWSRWLLSIIRVSKIKNKSLCSSGVIAPLTASASVRGLRLRIFLVGRIVCARFVLFQISVRALGFIFHAVYKDFI